MVFANRRAAGQVLAERLGGYQNRSDVIVLALPRGGVPVGVEVARALRAPLDVFVVRKLGVPGHEELAMGAIASGGIRVVNHDVVGALGIPEAVIDAVAVREAIELERRERTYRGGRPLRPIAGQIVILVDDGVATGSTLRAAVDAARRHAPAKAIVAVPVGAPETCRSLAEVADEAVCVQMPESFAAVGQWYRDFSQTTDEEVRALLEPFS